MNAHARVSLRVDAKSICGGRGDGQECILSAPSIAREARERNITYDPRARLVGWGARIELSW